MRNQFVKFRNLQVFRILKRFRGKLVAHKILHKKGQRLVFVERYIFFKDMSSFKFKLEQLAYGFDFKNFSFTRVGHL